MRRRGPKPVSEFVGQAVQRLMKERPRRFTAHEIAEQFGLSRRSVFRLAKDPRYAKSNAGN